MTVLVMSVRKDCFSVSSLLIELAWHIVCIRLVIDGGSHVSTLVSG